MASGCQKMRAETSLKKTSQTVSKIEEVYGGKTHDPDKITAIRQTIDRANGLLATDASQALVEAQNAARDTEQLLESVRPKQANDLYNKAQEEIRVATFNDLPRIANDRYTRIQEINKEAGKAKDENRWDDVISRSNEIIQEVATGLSTLKQGAERNRLDAEGSLNELRQIGGPVYVPEVVISVQDQINGAVKIAEKERDYTLAANKFAEAKVHAEEGITQVRREQAREKIEQIEGLLATALVEGVKQFKPEDYENSNRLLKTLADDYNRGSFTTVIEGAELLIPRAQTLVIETKRAASDDRISTMLRNINELQDGGILEYLPGSLDRLQAFLASAQETRKRNVEEAFDEIKRVSVDAADEYDRVRGNFQQLAQDRIRDGKSSLEATRAVFEQMETIFDPIEGEMDSDQKAFEAQKSTRRVELGKGLEEANTNLLTADIRQQDGKFKGAIVLAEEVKRSSERILSEVYHVVGHNASIELAKLISRYERDGAREYAPEELQRSVTKLEEVKKTIADAQYQRSVSLAAEARADVELMAQRIAGRATVDLGEARRSFSSATSEKTRKYRAAMLDEVGSLIEKAEGDLQAGRLKLALETANRATTLANQAKKEANRLAADEQVTAAEMTLTTAQDAGAEVYAGRELEDARKLLTSARSVYAAEDYEKAEELASSARERAYAGLYKKINDAETEIASAKAVGGWDYSSSVLASANTKVREARIAMDEKRWNDAASLADSARSEASGLTVSAKANTFATRTAAIRANLDAGTQQGINFFQPEESIAIRKKLAELQNSYTDENYERVMVEVEKLEASLRGTLDGTSNLVYTVADQQEARAKRLEDAGATSYAAAELAQAKSSLEYARIDYKRGLYASAHKNLRKAIDLLDNASARDGQERYSSSVRELFAEYIALQLQFQNVLTLDPVELKNISIGANGAAQSVSISSQISPIEFRKGLDKLYTRALELKAPESMKNLHEGVITAFTEGRVAALHFEKLAILNRVARREAEELIDQAYIRMNKSNQIVTAIQQQLISDEVRFRLVQNDADVLARTTAN